MEEKTVRAYMSEFVICWKTEQKWVWKRLRLCDGGYLLHFDFVAIRVNYVSFSGCSCCRWWVFGLALCWWVCGRCGWGTLRCHLTGCCLQELGNRPFWVGRCLGSIGSWCSLSLLGCQAEDILCLDRNKLRSFGGCLWWCCIHALDLRSRTGGLRGLGGLSWVLFGLL